jgi:membrane-associated HD superfamily phosphohydrolase
MARRPPLAASIRSQMRSAEQRFRRDVTAAVRKAERDINRELAAAQQKTDQKNQAKARRLKRRIETGLRQSRPTVTYTTTERQFLGTVNGGSTA